MSSTKEISEIFDKKLVQTLKELSSDPDRKESCYKSCSFELESGKRVTFSFKVTDYQIPITGLQYEGKRKRNEQPQSITSNKRQKLNEHKTKEEEIERKHKAKEEEDERKRKAKEEDMERKRKANIEKQSAVKAPRRTVVANVLSKIDDDVDDDQSSGEEESSSDDESPNPDEQQSEAWKRKQQEKDQEEELYVMKQLLPVPGKKDFFVVPKRHTNAFGMVSYYYDKCIGCVHVGYATGEICRYEGKRSFKVDKVEWLPFLFMINK